GRIHFAHCRNVHRTGPRRFHEAPHPSALGDVDMRAVLSALRDTGFDGPMRPDHGRMIWGERGRPGYGLHDRALGATYLYGLWEGISRHVIRLSPQCRIHMRTSIFVFSWLVGAMPCTNIAAQVDAPPVPREFRGAWVASVANIDWP